MDASLQRDGCAVAVGPSAPPRSARRACPHRFGHGVVTSLAAHLPGGGPCPDARLSLRFRSLPCSAACGCPRVGSSAATTPRRRRRRCSRPSATCTATSARACRRRSATSTRACGWRTASTTRPPRRAFSEAERLDPDCAMCAWGQALVLGPNINQSMPADLAADATALARPRAAPARPRGPGGPRTDRRAREALRRAAARRPRAARRGLRRGDAPGRAAPSRRRRRRRALRRGADGPVPGRTGTPTASRAEHTARIVAALEARAARAIRTTSARCTTTSTRWRRRRARSAPSATPTGSPRSRPGPATSCTCPRTSTSAPAAITTRRSEPRREQADTRVPRRVPRRNGIYPLGYVPHN